MDVCDTIRFSVRDAEAVPAHIISVWSSWLMSLNKKQKKQIDSLKKKLANLQQQLAGARKQPDDPADIPRLEKEIASVQKQIQEIQAAG